jgi:hypothetical protein
MGQYWRHFKTVCRHKYYVFKECAACGIWWQGLIHDLSKFGPTEFVSSARYFQGTRSPIEAEKEEIGYSKAWLHHKGHNKHHWEYWTDFAEPDGRVIATEMPINYVVEMVCDWIGAGKAYSTNAWTQNSPLQHYTKMRPCRYFHPNTEKLLLELVNMIADRGLDEFHKYAKTILTKYKRGQS